jgi:hypothetical protein
MGIYLNGQLVIADDALVTGDVKLLGGGAIKTVDNNDLTLLPNGTGITVVGDAGSTSQGLATNDDLYIAGQLEVDGTAFFDGLISCGTIFMGSSAEVSSGSAAYGAYVGRNTAQAQDSFALFTGSIANSLLVAEHADRNTDFGHAQQVNPTLFIQSADATTIAQWVSLAHDQTDGVLGCGAGDIKISTVANQTIVLVQSVWDDLRVPLTSGLIGASNPPSLVQFMDNGAGSVGVYVRSFADQAVAGNEEQMWFQAQLPHTYKEGTDIKAHIHWSPAVSGAAGEFVKWGLEYTWANVDGTFGNTTIIASDASSASTATTSGDSALTADKH